MEASPLAIIRISRSLRCAARSFLRILVREVTFSRANAPDGRKCRNHYAIAMGCPHVAWQGLLRHETAGTGRSDEDRVTTEIEARNTQ